MTKNSYHVIFHIDGGWAVRKWGAARALKRFKSESDAISYGRKISQKHGAVFVLHKRDGTVALRDSYRNGHLVAS